MDDRSSRDQLQPLLAALRELITPGVYAAALEDSPLVDLPTVTARTGAGAPRAVRAQAFIELLESVIAGRLSRTDKAAASILFAVGDWAGVPVRERHYQVARLRNKHWTWERNYRKEPLSRDLLTVLRALLREGDAAVVGSGASSRRPAARTSPGSGAAAEAEFHLRRLGRRRTAYPLDMSLEELVRADLAVPIKLGSYHERQGPGPARGRVLPVPLSEVVRYVAEGRSVLLLGEPGAGKTLAMYQLASACAAAGMTPVPVRAREIVALTARPGWAALREAVPGVVVLLDSLDEAAEVIAQDQAKFAIDLTELLSIGPYVVSSRMRDYEELASSGFPDPGFDAVFVIQPWTLDGEFRDYLSRLASVGLLDEPALYEAVVGSADLPRLVTRPLYARMLTFVGERAARSLRDHHELYGEYLARLSLVTEHELDGRVLPTGGALALWQAAAWASFAAGSGAGDTVPLAEVEDRLAGELPRAVLRRVLDQVIERGSSHGRETGEFIHYSFYEHLVAREVRDRILRNPGPAEIAELLRTDLPREIRHHLIGQLRVAGDASLRNSLFTSYESVRHVLDIPDRDRLAACNLLVYLISRAAEDCTHWLRGQLASEPVIFLRHAMLWAMCHGGSANAVKLSGIRLVIHISTGLALSSCGFRVTGCQLRSLTLD
jgi:predicted ATPase